MRAKLCLRHIKTGRVSKGDWQPAEEAEMYLKRRKSLEDSPYSWCTNWIEYEPNSSAVQETSQADAERKDSAGQEDTSGG